MAQKVFVKAASSPARLSGNEAITVKTLHLCSAAAEEMLGESRVDKNGKKVSVAHQWLNGRKLLSCNFLLAFTPETSYHSETDTSVGARSGVGAEAAKEVKVTLCFLLQKRMVRTWLRSSGEIVF